MWAQVRKRWGFDGGRTAALMQSGGQATIWEPHPWEVRTWPQPGRQALIEAHKSTSSLIREGSGGFAMIVSASGMGGAGSGFSTNPSKQQRRPPLTLITSLPARGLVQAPKATGRSENLFGTCTNCAASDICTCLKILDRLVR